MYIGILRTKDTSTASPASTFHGTMYFLNSTMGNRTDILEALVLEEPYYLDGREWNADDCKVVASLRTVR